MKRFRMIVEGNLGDSLANLPIEELKKIMQEDLNMDVTGQAKLISLEEVPLLPEASK